MSDLVIQASFNSGEWAPTLYSRVDLQKYRSGAALLENLFVDYRGGASTRAGTEYILQVYKSNTPVRLIPFQASFNVGYVLEFGDFYMRPFINKAPVLEPTFAITAAPKANPAVLTITGNNYSIGQWIFIFGVGGMTELNGRYFSILNVAGSAITLGDLNGVPINSTGYGTYTSGGTSARVYTISSPYAANDLRLVKFSQNVNKLIMCHPAYPPQELTLNDATNWTINPIVFGSTAGIPINVFTSTTLGAGLVNYSYKVTSIDSGGQESEPSLEGQILLAQDIRSVAGSNFVGWNTVSGAIGYNVYKTDVSYFGPPPSGMTYGFCGTCTTTNFVDSNIGADFSQTPPVAKNPFNSASGSGVNFVTVINPSVYTTVPLVSFIGGTPTIAASAAAILGVIGTPTVAAGGTGFAVGDRVVFNNTVVLVVAAETAGVVTAWEPMTNQFANPGQVTAGAVPSNPLIQVSSSGVGTGATADVVWGVVQVQVNTHGAGFLTTPTIAFSAGAAAATPTMFPASTGYPSVPGFFQQRLFLAAPSGAPQTFYASQPGAYYNFDISQISQATDSLTGTLVSGQLNTIKAMVPQTSGLLILTDKASWLVNGGSNGSAISPSALVANAQSFNGISDVPPIVANFDVLYVQEKGSIVRDSSYNIYANVFTGTDISVLASHLFYGYKVLEWAWAEEPFKIVWAVRDDGALLSLTFLKEQEFIGWAHSFTQGSFKSICTVVEDTVTSGEVDSVYHVVERTINGFVVKYIERFAERQFLGGIVDAWTVDAGLQYNGVPATSFTGGEHLAGATVTGLADGQPITPFVMPMSGNFTLPVAASKVTVGLGFTAKLQTLALELGEPTTQGKVKQIPYVDIRVADTLGLDIGSDFDNLVPMKDLIRGEISSMLTGQSNQLITDLVTGDARTYIDATYTIQGQYCIQQSLPYPASILGVIPAVTMGDTGKQK